MSASPAIVQDQDIYVVSGEGEEELRASGTSLSPGEIELLVRIDGRLSVAEIAAGTRIVAPANVAEVVGRLLHRGLIRLRSRKSAGPGGLADFLADSAPARPTRGALTKARPEAASGASALQKRGYYVRIARRDASRRKPADGAKLTAIVVEDEPHLAKFLKQYLALEGIESRIAGDRDGILQAFGAPPLPDLVLLDVMLPDADGFDILVKMRRHPALKSVPVIMLTAKATREAVLQGLAGGADGYITKPFDAEVLITAVKAVIGAAKEPAARKKPGLSWY